MNNPIKVYALGGLYEIGKNMYGIEQDDEIILIDSGVAFNEFNNGVNLIIPSYKYLEDNKDKIKALFITHGHEDHIGGIPYLLNTVDIPVIYAAGFAIPLIKGKMKDFANPRVDIDKLIVEYNSESIIKFKHFTVSFFKTNHSIPDSFGLAMQTELGYILHTGDFKFDLTPISNEFDYYKVADFGKKGVLLLLSDSTNANVTNPSVSEKKVSASLKTQFSHIKGRIIIATFASNTYRIGQIINASIATNRKIVILGRSMERNVTSAIALNYINAPRNAFIPVDEFPFIRDDNVTVLVTGTQGEPMAALSRIASGTHKYIKIKKGDTIIFSSSAIPGNQEHINQIINKLYVQEANVITNSSLIDTHTSGHASANELQLMLNLCKPKYFMPIHGEYAMLKKHVELAMEVGINERNCFVLNNGDILNLIDDKAYIKGKVYSDSIFIDADGTIVNTNIIKERRQLSDDGFLCIILNLDDEKMFAKPSILTRGFIYNKNSKELFYSIFNTTVAIVNEYIEANGMNKQEIKKLVLEKISEFLFTSTGRKPLLDVILL